MTTVYLARPGTDRYGDAYAECDDEALARIFALEQSQANQVTLMIYMPYSDDRFWAFHPDGTITDTADGKRHLEPGNIALDGQFARAAAHVRRLVALQAQSVALAEAAEIAEQNGVAIAAIKQARRQIAVEILAEPIPSQIGVKIVGSLPDSLASAAD